MPKTTIKRDSHGLYVKTGGLVFRPGRNSYFDAGDSVKARHLPQSEIAKIQQAGDTVRFAVKNEYWIAHGMYGKYGEGGHEKCWNPELTVKFWTSNYPVVINHKAQPQQPQQPQQLTLPEPLPDPFELQGCGGAIGIYWQEVDHNKTPVRQVKLLVSAGIRCGESSDKYSDLKKEGVKYWIAACKECAIKAGWQRLPGGDRLGKA